VRCPKCNSYVSLLEVFVKNWPAEGRAFHLLDTTELSVHFYQSHHDVTVKCPTCRRVVAKDIGLAQNMLRRDRR
jgi:hypothetical protein